MNFFAWRFGKQGATACDESLAEHDKKYHPDGFDPERETCNKRADLAKADKGDVLSPSEGAEKGGDKPLVSAAEDAAYMDAVKRGDMETAERMVREAAAKAMPSTKVVADGEPLVVYHGTSDGGFNSFDTDGRREAGKTGAWFTTVEPYARYGFAEGEENGQTYSVYLNIKNPAEFIFDGMYSDGWDGFLVGKIEGADPSVNYHGRINSGTMFFTEDAAKKYAEENGLDYEESSFSHDELVARIREFSDLVNGRSFGFSFWNERLDSANEVTRANILESRAIIDDVRKYFEDDKDVDINNVDGVILRNIGDRDSNGNVYVGDQIISFDPSQIKSADPVTYDDDGNVIPLSCRFVDGGDIHGDVSKKRS